MKNYIISPSFICTNLYSNKQKYLPTAQNIKLQHISLHMCYSDRIWWNTKLWNSIYGNKSINTYTHKYLSLSPTHKLIPMTPLYHRLLLFYIKLTLKMIMNSQPKKKGINSWAQFRVKQHYLIGGYYATGLSNYNAYNSINQKSFSKELA